MAVKMVPCRSCGEQIAKSAKVCPHCGAKNKKNTVLWVIVVILVIGFIVGAFGGGSDNPTKVNGDESNIPPANQSENQEDSNPGPEKFGVGEHVELNKIIVTLVDVRENSGTTYNKPTDGNVFVVCEFEIENNSDKEIAISSMLSFDTYFDDYSASISLSGLMSEDGTQQLDGTIAGGKKMKGMVAYEAASDWSEIEVHFTPDFWSGKDIIFTYSK